jgi:hypothetical protein
MWQAKKKVAINYVTFQVVKYNILIGIIRCPVRSNRDNQMSCKESLLRIQEGPSFLQCVVILMNEGISRIDTDFVIMNLFEPKL